MFTLSGPIIRTIRTSVSWPTSFQEHRHSDWCISHFCLMCAHSWNNQNIASFRRNMRAPGMQAPSTKVPTVKSRGPSLKQRYDVWSGPGPIATFVRCLRLLDLDLLEDWPGISEHTFSTLPLKQSLQARIKCVEWGLYRLFELWSPSETRDVWSKCMRCN